ncbi:MAG: hypothetical protein ACE5KL_01105 [Alphaproteobacteria bacterium]
MKGGSDTVRVGFLAAVLALALAGCSTGEPFDPAAEGFGQPDEMQPGPGLISGEDGELTIETDI